MKVHFDTSVLVAALVTDLKNHEASQECLLQYTSFPNEGFCTTHALAECYSTLTVLPLRRRIQPTEAATLISESLSSRLTVVETQRNLYIEAIQRVSRLGLISGIVYDAIHLIAAESTGCDRLYTYNLRHFHTLNQKGMTISAP
jgi:predicted nucleic acid-binding protein